MEAARNDLITDTQNLPTGPSEPHAMCKILDYSRKSTAIYYFTYLHYGIVPLEHPLRSLDIYWIILSNLFKACHCHYVSYLHLPIPSIESVLVFVQSRAWCVSNSKLCDRSTRWHALSKSGLGILLQLMTSCLTMSDFRGGMPRPRPDLDLEGETQCSEHWLANTTQTFHCDTWEARIPGQRRVLPKPTKEHTCCSIACQVFS